MARGLPAVWSTVLALPFLGSGAYLLLATDRPELLGWSLVGFGGFIVVVGVYIHFVAAPEPPVMGEDEEVIDTRHPSQRVAIARASVGSGLLVVTAYLLFGTRVPYMYPTGTFLFGLFFFSNGLYTYWANTLRTYYVTNRRVISVYRFLSLVNKEIPLEKVRGIQERRSFTETLVGLGNVSVASGAGGQTLEITMRNIEDSTAFANQLRELV